MQTAPDDFVHGLQVVGNEFTDGVDGHGKSGDDSSVGFGEGAGAAEAPSERPPLKPRKGSGAPEALVDFAARAAKPLIQERFRQQRAAIIL
jgi:hypothetical protein